MLIKQHLDENRADAKNLGTVHKSFDDSNNGSIMDLRKLFALVGAFYWLFMTLVVVPVGCIVSLYTIIYPLLIVSWLFGLRITFVNRIENFLCHLVNDHWTAAGQFLGLNVSEYGDDINDIADKRVLFLCNHLALIDHFCLMTAFSNKKSLPGRYMWVIFNIWKFTSLGAMWLAHGNFFINGGASRRAAVLKNFRDHLRSLYWKYEYGFVVMYPEGSRLYLIKNTEQRFAEKNGLITLNHCAHPRIGAAHSALTVAGKSLDDETKAVAGDFPPFEYIVDATLGYPKGEAPDLAKVILAEWPNRNSNVAVHYRIHKVKAEWQDEEKLKQWLYTQYEQKDKLLEKFYTTNSFGGKPRPVNLPIGRSLFVEFFWIAVFYCHYNAWFKPLAIFICRSIGF